LQDIIFNFDRVYQIIDEIFISGEMQESSPAVVLRHLGKQGNWSLDLLVIFLDEQMLAEVMDDALLFH
jgi:hypothetical protein